MEIPRAKPLTKEEKRSQYFHKAKPAARITATTAAMSAPIGVKTAPATEAIPAPTTSLVKQNDNDMVKAKAAGFKAPTIPTGLMQKLGRIAYTTYRDAKIKLPPEDIAELAAELYRKLQELVQNINDMEEIELTLPLLKLHLKRQIEAERVHLEATQNSA